METETTKEALYRQAKELGVAGRSEMDKDELARAVDAAGSPVDEPPPPGPTGNWLEDHLLTVILLGLFLASLIGQFYFQSARSGPGAPTRRSDTSRAVE